MPFPYLGETQTLDDAARAALPGEFVALPAGVTHYEIDGPADGAPVVLVHGFSVPCYIWDPTFEALAAAGFRTLRYDLFGRGFSDRPRVKYTLDFFADQLRDLLVALDFPAPVNLVGLSMGGPITLRFVDRFPQRVKRLALIDPAGFPLRTPWYMRLILLPGVGELFFGLLGPRFLLRSMAEDFFSPREIGYFLERYKEQMRYRGFLRAILSTLRGDALGDQRALYRRAGELGLPVLLIWGCHDRTVPFAYSHEARALMPQAKFYPVEDAGHIPHYERPEVVNPLLVEFLQRGEVAAD